MSLSSAIPTDERHSDLRATIGLTYLTLAWMSIEAVAALGLGWSSFQPAAGGSRYRQPVLLLSCEHR